MHLIIKKTLKLNGAATIPSSKSQSIRALILALMAQGESCLTKVLDSEDTQDALKVCKDLGAYITLHENQLILKSDGLPLKTEAKKINSGNSGITTYFVMPILGLRKNSDQPIILDCDEQMRARPVHPLVNALRNLGMTIKYLKEEQKLPLAISGYLTGGSTEVDGMSSQYLSALLMALPCAENKSEIRVKDLHERSYVEMTLNWLKTQNIHYAHQKTDTEDVYLIQGKQRYKNFKFTIPGDFSSASYLIAAATLIKGSVELKGLDRQDSQGDKALVHILQKMGADISTKETSLIIQGEKTLTGLKIDANDIPDLLPILAVIGTQACGKTEIINVQHARIKETDRIHSMTEGLRALGAKIEEYENGMTIYQSKLRGASVKGYGDHRTVMALSVAGMLAEDSTLIDDSEAIHKTFPNFIELMCSLGAKMELCHEASS